MRLAVYNAENLFDRAKAMNLDTWEEGKPILDAFAKLNTLLGEETYTAAIKRRMVDLMVELGLEKSDKGPFVILRRNKGGLVKRPKTGGIEITADSRTDWVGSLELLDEPINEVSMRVSARVMGELEADILGLVEVESRPVLAVFNKEIIAPLGGQSFAHVMVIDGNDTRGIDVGIMSKPGFPIRFMRSHVDDPLPDGEFVFSRDCPEYAMATVTNKKLVVMVNHFKSKGFGTKAKSDARRKAQAEAVRDIYKAVVAAGEDMVAVMGDLNDTPDSDPLQPLLKGTDLKDVFKHPRFDDGGFPGTYDLCGERNKIDYILLSPKLFARVQAGGVFRKGMWPGSRPKRWETFPEVTRQQDAGSDHAAVWVDVDL